MWKKNNNFCTLSKKYPDKYFHFKKFQCLKLNTLFSLKGTKCIQKKTINICHRLKNVSRQVCPCQKSSVFEIELFFFQSKERNVCGRRLTFFVTLKKKLSRQNSHAKKSIKGTKCMWKKNINFCTLSKNVSRQLLPCQKTSVFKNEYNFFNQRNEKYVKEDYQLLSSFKNLIPTSTSMPKILVFVIEYTSFNQRKEMYVEADHQFLSHF